MCTVWQWFMLENQKIIRHPFYTNLNFSMSRSADTKLQQIMSKLHNNKKNRC